MECKNEGFFSRQNILFDKKVFEDKTITIIGLGGLGSNVFNNLLRLGFKNFILIDDDKVEESNIHRTIFNYKDIGKFKIEVLKEYSMKVYNYKKSIILFKKKFEFLEEKEYEKIKDSDLIVDCTDNMKVRFLISKFCKDNKKDYVYGTAVKNFGEAKIFLYEEKSYKEYYNKKTTLKDCSQVGVNPNIMFLIAVLQSELVRQYFVLGRKNLEKKFLRFNLENFLIIKY